MQEEKTNKLSPNILKALEWAENRLKQNDSELNTSYLKIKSIHFCLKSQIEGLIKGSKRVQKLSFLRIKTIKDNETRQ